MDRADIRGQARGLLVEIADPQGFIEALQALLRTLVNEEATRNYQRIIPDTGKFYGVPKPALWITAAEMGRFITEKPEKAAELLKAIWAEGSFESRQIAGKSLEKFGPKYSKICLEFVSSVVPELDNWSICDSLAMYGVEPVVFSNPELVLPLSEKWIGSIDKWVRRFGVVTLRGYKRIPATGKVFVLLAMVMDDREREVRMAVAWILREITKVNTELVAEFLTKQAQAGRSKDKRRIIVDGMKKLNPKDQRRILGLFE